jgi:hypothetical protein
MENQDIDILSVEFNSENLIVNYINDTTETLPINIDTYKAFYEKWLVPNPPFISDIFKIQMRNITLASINNNQKCIADLNRYFSSPNEEVVKNFLTYMRNRENTLPFKKAQWTPI